MSPSSCYPSSTTYNEPLQKDVGVVGSDVDFQDAQFQLPAKINDKVLKFQLPPASGYLDLMQMFLELELQLFTHLDT
jgi:hypothetical protein